MYSEAGGGLNIATLNQQAELEEQGYELVEHDEIVIKINQNFLHKPKDARPYLFKRGMSKRFNKAADIVFLEMPKLVAHRKMDKKLVCGEYVDKVSASVHLTATRIMVKRS